MPNSEQGSSSDNWDGFKAKYCESCGQLFEASEKIEENVDEPVHRVDIIEAIGPFEEVGETTALEKGNCEDCGGQVVDRWYVYPAGNVPETDYEPDPEHVSGRDPDEDALFAMSSDPDAEDFEEVREIPWLEAGEDDE